MGKLKLPRLLSDGMVLQQKKPIHIWGWDEPGRKITVNLSGEEAFVITDDEGRFSLYLNERMPGGPYELMLTDEAGEKEYISDIFVGDVFLCSGQSNMELPMERVKDKYPDEKLSCENNKIRTFKITEHSNFHRPLDELLSGEWVNANPESIMKFSATAYFFAKELYSNSNVAVGLIDASLGGSLLESWLGRDMIEAEAPYPEIEDIDLDGRSNAEYEAQKNAQKAEWLQLIDKYSDDDFVAELLRKNEKQNEEWHKRLDDADIGLSEGWAVYDAKTIKKIESDVAAKKEGWKKTKIPFFFKDTALKGFIGSVWFLRTFDVSEEMSNKAAQLWLGTIVDSDTVYINGREIGHTDYQYPPRKYEIPKGLLKTGSNSIIIRVKVDNGLGRFTLDKTYAVWNDRGRVDLTGCWHYKVGAVCDKAPERDFVNWKPTGLYNGMTAPCHNYPIGGILWYQGESNDKHPETYLEGLKRLIGGYRRKWNDESLPFFYVQLPNFCIDLESDEDSGWREIREKQRRALKIPDTGMAVAIDLGEDNDLHPLNKEDVGKRLAYLAVSKLYDDNIPCHSPQIEAADIFTDEKQHLTVEMMCSDVGSGLCAMSKDKGSKISDFEIIDEEGTIYPAEAELKDEKIILTAGGIKNPPKKIRYCYKNTNSGALIYNSYNLPMSPFVLDLSEVHQNTPSDIHSL